LPSGFLDAFKNIFLDGLVIKAQSRNMFKLLLHCIKKVFAKLSFCLFLLTIITVLLLSYYGRNKSIVFVILKNKYSQNSFFQIFNCIIYQYILLLVCVYYIICLLTANHCYIKNNRQ
jgi:hypothetical protein